ncbi:hypothetical protein LOD99_5077 [Oopsacas minuta]|uniref:AB hydrolase-1 domain-containing protein n=1 Tax=Oopsacas minuta TaxID=111878 RepID=A0AAV7JSF9_9METZ|nr:hypothetical protein LOD99_5077 [Oopsacas minuta]
MFSISIVIALILLSFVLSVFLLKKHILCKKGSINIRLFYDDNLFNQEMISLIPQFSRNYDPPCWIRNRTTSTLIFGILGRFGSRQVTPVGIRQRVKLPDGTAAIFDLYLDPIREDPLLQNIILIVIPGLSNHSASDYVRAYIEYASSHGFRVACLDHLGSDCGEAINPESPRIHTYGGTGDLSAMVDYLRDKYPGNKFIGVGFSIGANILLKYLGERPERQSYFLAAQSWCQGYDVITCLPYISGGISATKLFYNLISKKKKLEYNALLDIIYSGKPTISQNNNEYLNSEVSKCVPEDELKPLMSASKVNNEEIQTADCILPSVEPHPPLQPSELERDLPSWVPTYAYQKIGREVSVDNPPRDVNGFLIEGWEDVPPFDINEFNRHSGIVMLDTHFTRPLLGFNTIEDMYRWACCIYVMDQIKDLPVLLVNAKDDPMVPWQVAEDIMSNHSRVNSKAIGIITQHGGHLGFYEGSCCARKRVSWVDKIDYLSVTAGTLYGYRMISDTSLPYPVSISSLPLATLLLLCLVVFLLFLKKFMLCKKGSINIRLFYDDNLFNQEMISLIPQFTRNYIPPCWIRNRITSTLFFGILGRFGNEQTNPIGNRHRVNLPDGTTITFDLYLDPIREDPLLQNVIIVIIPGVSNHSASDYMRAYIEYASSNGFKVASLNHMGSACGEAINPESPRIHTYGGTGDLSAMVDYLRDKYPGNKFIGVGFSLGANVLLKYLGERPERQSYFLAAQSWCQGYHLNICIPHMNRLGNGAKLFNHLLTKKKKAEVRNILGTLFGGKPSDKIQKQYLVTDEFDKTPEDELKPLMSASKVNNEEIQTADCILPSVEPHPPLQPSELERDLPSWVPTYAYQKIGREVSVDNPPRDVNGFLIEGWEDVPPFDINEFNRATDIASIDACFCRAYLGFQTREDFYNWSSSLLVMDQIKDLPVLLVNARDDPVIPWRVVEEIMSDHSRVNSKAIGIITQHGGHLGFYEGSCCARKRVSWVDKLAIFSSKSSILITHTDVINFYNIYMGYLICVTLAILLPISILIVLLLKKYLISPNCSTNIRLIYQDTHFNREIVSSLPQLTSSYTPPLLFRYGIACFLTFALKARFGSKQNKPIGSRQRVRLPDGTDTMFDLYLDPIREDPLLQNVMIVVLPGILNHSGTDYMRAYIEYASSQGFKVACYNHLGSLPDEDISSEAPRFISYGGTGDITVMMDFLIDKFPDMTYIGVGFSMGANIILKYLGEQPKRQSYFLCAQSWCQGYHAGRCIRFEKKMSYPEWIIWKIVHAKLKYKIKSRYLDKLYSTTCLNKLNKTDGLESSENSLVSNELPSWVHTYACVKGRKRGVSDPSRDDNGYLIDGWEDILPFNLQQFRNSTFMDSLDLSFNCPLLGFKNLDEFYDWNSSLTYMNKIKDLPVLLVNPKNDYLVPWQVIEDIVKGYCEGINANAIGVWPDYGGHLAFYQGSYFSSRVSWRIDIYMGYLICVTLAILLPISILIVLLLKKYLISPNCSTNIRLIYQDTHFNREIVSSLPQLTSSYTPPLLFRYGIVSTLAFAAFGRFKRKQSKPIGSRQRVRLPDGTDTMFDLYLDPIREDPLLQNVMIVVLPGILNHSGTDYMRAYIEYASSQGFKVACYNHLGSLPDEDVSSEAPRFISYGGTGDITVMMDFLIDKFPDMTYIGVGFSMGANIILKYLGEQPKRQSYFLCAQSWCQGYHAGKFANKLGIVSWLIYKLVFIKLKYIIKSRYLDKLYSTTCLNKLNKTDELESSENSLVSNELPSWVHTYACVKGRKRGVSDPSRDDNGYLIDGWEDIPPFNLQQFRNSTFMDSLDLSFNCPLLGFKNLSEFYDWNSSLTYMNKIKDLPVLLVNPKNDYLVPWQVIEDIVKGYCEGINANAIGVWPDYGGHLAFYQGSYFPSRVSWLDVVSIQHARSIVLSQTSQVLNE